MKFPSIKLSKAIRKTGGSSVQFGKNVSRLTGAYYRSKDGSIVYKRKQGPTSVKDPILRRLNAYHRANPEQSVHVKYVYGERSRVMRSTENILAVKTDEGLKGWLTDDGKFIGLDTFRATLANVDNTIVGDASGLSLLDAFDSMSPAFKIDSATDRYFELVDLVGDLLGW